MSPANPAPPNPGADGAKAPPAPKAKKAAKNTQRKRPAAPPAATAASAVANVVANPGAVADLSKRIIANVENAIVGKRKQLVLSMVAWLSGGHILLEDVPGVAKTLSLIHI